MLYFLTPLVLIADYLLKQKYYGTWYAQNKHICEREAGRTGTQNRQDIILVLIRVDQNSSKHTPFPAACNALVTKKIQIYLPRNQCCGSGSVCFGASWIRIHQSEIWIRLRVLLSPIKNSKKILIPTAFWLLFDFLSLKNDVNVPSKCNKQKNFFSINFF